ncbi:MAG: nucleoid occlusion factor SlmA [Proteobacteria bacterium]|nr:nucleoid occlusion factor SlmA [Pseudomonadota bacterium]
MARKPGERKTQILQTLASMLEQPQSEKITTAALAARVGVSEAALYRHFASKAQMFDALIEFIEESVFTLVNQITQAERDGRAQVQQIVAMLLGFAEKNPGMVRVLTGDALVHEDGRLQLRINQLLDRIEASLKQSLQVSAVPGGTATATSNASLAAAHANALTAFVIGRWQLFAKSGFKRSPNEHWSQQAALLRL